MPPLARRYRSPAPRGRRPASSARTTPLRGRRRSSPCGAPWPASPRASSTTRSAKHAGLDGRRSRPQAERSARCRASSGRRPSSAGRFWPPQLQHLVGFGRGAQHRIAGAAADIGRERDPHRSRRIAQPRQVEQAAADEQIRRRAEHRDRPAVRQPPRLRRRRDGCNGRTATVGPAGRSGRRHPCSWLRLRESRARPSRSRPDFPPDASACTRRDARATSAPAASSCASVEVMREARRDRHSAAAPCPCQRSISALAFLDSRSAACRSSPGGALRSIITLPAIIRVSRRSASAKNASTDPGCTVHRPPPWWCRCAAARPGRSRRCAPRGPASPNFCSSTKVYFFSHSSNCAP